MGDSKGATENNSFTKRIGATTYVIKFMAKQRRTLDERIQNCTTKEEAMLEKFGDLGIRKNRLEITNVLCYI